MGTKASQRTRRWGTLLTVIGADTSEDLLNQQPLELSPEHFMPGQNVHKSYSPEEKLLYELLKDAAHCALADERMAYVANVDAGRKLLQQQLAALEWIYTTGNDPYQFEWVCEHLEFQADKIRGQIMTLTRWAGAVRDFLELNRPLPIDSKFIQRSHPEGYWERRRQPPGEAFDRPSCSGTE